MIEGKETTPTLPPAGDDTLFDQDALAASSAQALWPILAPHPRLRRLRAAMMARGLRLSEISDILFSHSGYAGRAQDIIDAAARAQDPRSGARLLPWRAHLFHRAQGGLWACIDPACAHRDSELRAVGADWKFGGIWLVQRDRCACGAPTFELLACTECGTPHLVAGRESGALARLIPHEGAQTDEFLIDEEPDPDVDNQPLARDVVWLRPARATASDRDVGLDDGRLFDNGAPAQVRAIAVEVVEQPQDRNCCANAAKARLQPQRYGPPFFMGTVLPEILERLCEPLGQPGLPMSGRRAITFSDSRQGVARLAAKLQQDAERTLTRAFLYHVGQETRGPSSEEKVKLERKLKLYQSDPIDFAEDIAVIEKHLSGDAKPTPWNDLINRFAAQHELRSFAAKVWAERAWGGRELADNPEKLAEMFLYRELFRRPRVQNNVETMGLARLIFPEMQAKAGLDVPGVLKGKGTDAWIGLAQTAIDFVFRDNFAVNVQNDNLARWINPRLPGRRSVYGSRTSRENAAEKSALFWPTPKPHQGRSSRLVSLIYALIEGDPEDRVDQDRAQEVLDALWDLITSTAARELRPRRMAARFL